MKREVVKVNKPGVYDFVVNFDRVGQAKEWLAIVDAREPGEYELRVVADHKVAKTKGRITVRAAAGKGAVLKIRGVIRIRKEAQETDDFLELRVLTLDKSARATVEPELEIETDNVRASHAASVGQVDEEQVLYLMSRGLSKNQAINEIVGGFLMI